VVSSVTADEIRDFFHQRSLTSTETENWKIARGYGQQHSRLVSKARVLERRKAFLDAAETTGGISNMVSSGPLAW
jgi:hypothetical protein